MANISHGMNVAEVKRLGQTLQNRYAADINRFITEIESMVNSTTNTWVGPDAVRFRSWWPQKRAALRTIAQDLHGFGQSALNNASEQETSSSR